MSAEDQMAAPDTPGEPASQVDAEQSTTAQPGSLAALIMEQAKDEGTEIGDQTPPEVAPSEEPQPEEVEQSAELQVAAEKPKAEEPPQEQSEEEKPATEEEKLKRMVPLREVMEERAKKERAKDRADEAEKLRFAAEGRVQELQQQLAKALGPQPRENDPVYDVQDPVHLETLKRDYQRFLDETDDVLPSEETGLIEGVLVGREPDGSPKRADLKPEQFKKARDKAKAAIREHIPEQEKLLSARYVEDQKVVADYPELMEDRELQNTFAFLYNEVLTGRAAKSPELSRWIVRAAKVYLQEQQNNGAKTPAVTNADSKKIIESAKQQIAPTPTRTRTVPVRRGADLANAEKRFEKEGTPEAAEAVIAARLFRPGNASAERLEQTAE